jgi:hypothetical protein
MTTNHHEMDISEQIRLKRICKYFYSYFCDFYHILNELRNKLSDKILKNYYFVRSLSAYNNPGITNLNHLTTLKQLHASRRDRGIDDQLIQNLNLVELDAWKDPKITNINHMTNLKKLDAGWNCG